MVDSNDKVELDEWIRSSMQQTEEPSLKLNQSLKADLYRREALLQRQKQVYAVTLWYLPMILNAVTFGMLAVLALLGISNPYLSKFMMAVCLYIGAAGIFITMLGMKRTNLKEDMTVRIQKRGVTV